MSLDTTRACADRAQACPCVQEFRPITVTVRTRTWLGGRVGLGQHTDSDLLLTPNYPVRQLSSREVQASGGRYSLEDVIVEDIVPAYTSHGGGGYSAEQLVPAFTADERDKDVVYILGGMMTGEYVLASLNNSDPVFWSLVLRRTRATP